MGNHKVLKTAGINLRYSMYDFIDAVKKHRIIWDREHENFHNRELRDQAWQQIGQQLCDNFKAASGAEKQVIAKTLLKRWKNTRDSYLRVNRLRQSGEEISRASYIYEKELSFLLEVKAEDEEDMAVGEGEDESLKEYPKRTAIKRKPYRIIRTSAKRRTEQTDNSTTDNTVESSVEPMLDNLSCAATTHSQLNSTVELSSSTVHPSLNAVSSSGSGSDPDPDQAFFDSIKPHIQRMSSDQKLEFQIEVLEILRHFK